MFRVKDTVLSDKIATARFACAISRCKGACCVVGDAGAPVSEGEIPYLRQAYDLLKEELTDGAVDAVEKRGLVNKVNSERTELQCVNRRACVFVTYGTDGEALCAIQKAYMEGRIGWEKPLSCHLYPVRLKRVNGIEYANFDYNDDICSPACEKGGAEGIWLSDFLEKPLQRRYGRPWYREFTEACEEVRKNTGEPIET